MDIFIALVAAFFLSSLLCLDSHLRVLELQTRLDKCDL